MTRIAKLISIYFFLLPCLALTAIILRILRFIPRRFAKGGKPNLVWAGAPMLSLPYSSNAMRAAGYRSISIGAKRYKTVNKHDFDYWVQQERHLNPRAQNLVSLLRACGLFIWMMARFDILHGFFNGAIFHGSILCDWEYFLWKLSGGKLVLMPYGSDSFVHSSLPDTMWARMLKVTYPQSKAASTLILSRLERFSALADGVVGCIVHDVCLPRVDVLPILWYPANLECSVAFPSGASPLRIAHVSNHSQIKGTEIIKNTVSTLVKEGVKIELKIVVGADHETALAAIEWADLVVDQIHFGYALAALEAMARGKVVITGVTHEALYESYWNRDAFFESPIIFSGPSDLKDTIRQSAANPAALREKGIKSRAYVERHHGPKNTVRIFEELYRQF